MLRSLLSLASQVFGVCSIPLTKNNYEKIAFLKISISVYSNIDKVSNSRTSTDTLLSIIAYCALKSKPIFAIIVLNNREMTTLFNA
jgi:hypothetical protein